MTEPLFYKNGLNFSCQRCSHCCRHEPGYVYLSESDLARLCDLFNLSSRDFILKFCRWVPYYDGQEVLCLLEKENYDCVLWDGECTAYGARPIQCSTYPFWPFLLKSRTAWEAESRECPGINGGEYVSGGHIEKCLKSYELNVPKIRKEE